ncbi:MBOAT family O-acyltransferase [Sediminispirochaeta bajacaliforniensis]|uniref:MBOAT family O-acyltransferase n=1 Tax=Sediminispirochaeta bajacaliforniensis TaxID=148 RepID=UPI001B7FB423|nr:MBOAT family O-acyltransferase [Sediminispirochaeta bajacaliforniensis]
MSWNPKYALLIVTSTIITFFSGLLISKAGEITNAKKARKVKRACVALSFILNLSILGFFKYFNFTFNSIIRVLNLINISVVSPQIDIVLPVGISFYTFQALSYTMDVYRGEIKPERNIAKYALFVSFFPQLVAGPIERSKNLLKQIHEIHTFDSERVKNGLLLMLWGLFLKMVIADRAAILVNQVFNHHQQYAGFEIGIAVLLFAVQIYCDFAGYSTVAIGAAQVMGFRLMDNFHQPYFATSIRDFWHRWHISLSTWFRDYLYIPLGGNRKGKIRTYMNTFITFVISGLWHGASWHFVVWGALHGAFQIIGSTVKPFKKKMIQIMRINTGCGSYRVFQCIITFILTDLAWIFFRARNTTIAVQMIKSMFSTFNPWIFFDGSLFKMGIDSKEILVLIPSIIILFLVDIMHECNKSIRVTIDRQNLLFRWIIYYVAIFSLIIFGFYGSGYEASQFIYFQF